MEIVYTTCMQRYRGAAAYPSLGHQCGHHAVALDHGRVDAATEEPPEVDLTWLHRRPFSFIPPVTYRDEC